MITIDISLTLLVIAAVLAMLSFAVFLLVSWDETNREDEITRIRRERRLAEARINRLTAAAIQQMTTAAAPHSATCACSRCTQQGGDQ